MSSVKAQKKIKKLKKIENYMKAPTKYLELDFYHES